MKTYHVTIKNHEGDIMDIVDAELSKQRAKKLEQLINLKEIDEDKYYTEIKAD